MGKVFLLVLLAVVSLFSMGSRADSLKKVFDGSMAVCSKQNTGFGEVFLKMNLTSEGDIAVSLVNCSNEQGEKSIPQKIKDVSNVKYTIGQQTVVSAYSDFELLILNQSKEIKSIFKLNKIETSSEEVVALESALSAGDEVFVRAQRKLSVDGVEIDSGLISWGSYILLR